MSDLIEDNGKNELVFYDGKKRISKEISEESKNNYLHQFEILNTFSNVLIFYHALKENINELNNFLQNIVIPNGNYVEYSRANRYTLNTLSSFYSLISFCEKNILDFKNKIAHEIYDNYFSYRIFYNLRNYMTHRGLGITTFESNLLNGLFVTEAILYTDELISDKCGNAKFRNELINLKTNKIKIKEYTVDFSKSIDELIFKIFNENRTIIVDAFYYLRRTINNECCRCNDSYIKEKNNKKHGLLKSLNNFINIFSNEVVYANKIEQNPNINYGIFELFYMLSYAYFEKEGVAVKPNNK